eukprot:scaffold59854_cov38-Prasinocladus_malaysianus.AAC.1
MDSVMNTEHCQRHAVILWAQINVHPVRFDLTSVQKTMVHRSLHCWCKLKSAVPFSIFREAAAKRYEKL